MISSHLSSLLDKIAKDHHTAFIKTDGEDSKWAGWYAKKLLKNDEFKESMPKLPWKTLAHLLEMLDHQHRLEKSNSDWSKYYAKKLLKII